MTSYDITPESGRDQLNQETSRRLATPITDRTPESSAPLHSCSHRQALVFFSVKTHNDRVACNQCRQSATVEIVGKNSPKFLMGTNVALFKKDSAGSEELLCLGARAATGFCVEMDLHQ